MIQRTYGVRHSGWAHIISYGYTISQSFLSALHKALRIESFHIPLPPRIIPTTKRSTSLTAHSTPPTTRTLPHCQLPPLNPPISSTLFNPFLSSKTQNAEEIGAATHAIINGRDKETYVPYFHQKSPCHDLNIFLTFVVAPPHPTTINPARETRFLTSNF